MNKLHDIYLGKEEFIGLLLQEFPMLSIGNSNEVYIKRENIKKVFPKCFGIYSKDLYIGKLLAPDQTKRYIDRFYFTRNGKPVKKIYCYRFNKIRSFDKIKRLMKTEIIEITDYANKNGMENAVVSVWTRPTCKE